MIRVSGGLSGDADNNLESQPEASNLPDRMKLPKKIISRQAEITQEFLVQVDRHLADVLSGKAEKMYHIKDFAAIMFVHPVHLSNTIKNTTGHSPCYFFEEKLMDEARRLLREGQLSISGIAERLTFDTSNFTKFFKRFEGVTPSAYREQEITRQWEANRERSTGMEAVQ